MYRFLQNITVYYSGAENKFLLFLDLSLSSNYCPVKVKLIMFGPTAYQWKYDDRNYINNYYSTMTVRSRTMTVIIWILIIVWWPYAHPTPNVRSTLTQRTPYFRRTVIVLSPYVRRTYAVRWQYVRRTMTVRSSYDDRKLTVRWPCDNSTITLSFVSGDCRPSYRVALSDDVTKASNQQQMTKISIPTSPIWKHQTHLWINFFAGFLSFWSCVLVRAV